MAFGQVLEPWAHNSETDTLFETDLLAKQHPDLILRHRPRSSIASQATYLREINTLRAVREFESRALELEEETRRIADGCLQPRVSGSSPGS